MSMLSEVGVSDNYDSDFSEIDTKSIDSAASDEL